MAHGAALWSGAVAALVLSSAPPARAKDTPIRGARLSIVEKMTDTLTVTLENLRDSPLIAWEIGIVGPGFPDARLVETASFTAPFPFGSDNGPVPPGARRVMTLQSRNIPEGSAAVARLAVFADGYYEGQPASIRRLHRQWQAQADDVRYWLPLLQQAPRGPNEAMRAFLTQQLARHAARRDAIESAVANDLRNLAADDIERPPDWIATGLEHRLSDMRQHLAQLEQTLRPGPKWLAGDVSSVHVSSVAAPHGELYARIENLRDVPIEAFGLGTDAGTWMTTDNCGVVDAPPGRGPLGAGETREVRITYSRKADGTPPALKLSFVMFADLSFEGRAAEREALLRNREQYAAEMAAFIAVLSDAARQRPDEVLAFLEWKKRGRAVATAGVPNGFFLFRNIDQFIERAKTDPVGVAAMATGMIASLERQRVRLTRHRAR